MSVLKKPHPWVVKNVYSCDSETLQSLEEFKCVKYVPSWPNVGSRPTGSHAQEWVACHDGVRISEDTFLNGLVWVFYNKDLYIIILHRKSLITYKV